jgi:hypothetical protein
MQADKFSVLGYGKSSSNSRIATYFTEITICYSFQLQITGPYFFDKKHGEEFTDSSKYYCEERGNWII